MNLRGGNPGAGAAGGWIRRALAAGIVLALAMVGAAGCYQPNVSDGKLLCGPKDACPADYSCLQGHCWREGTLLPPPDAGDTPDVPMEMDSEIVDMTVPPVDMTVDTPPMEMACLLPTVAGCTPAATLVCDPVCQSGCACNQKCSGSSAGAATCLAIIGQKQPGDPCTITGYGAPGQDDDCAPGSICLRPGGEGSSRSYCFSLCLNDGNCKNTRCVPRPVAPAVGAATPPVVLVCDVPFVPCNPYTNEGCPADRPVCYLAAPDPAGGASRTVCEYTSGGAGGGVSCSWSRDCFGKLTCPRSDSGVATPGAGFCSFTCDATHPCSIGTCQPYGNTYGYCVTN